MADIIYKITITGGTSPGPYAIYYDDVTPSNIATRDDDGQPASGVTYTELTSVDGTLVVVPDVTSELHVYNELCSFHKTIVIPSGVGGSVIGYNFIISE